MSIPPRLRVSLLLASLAWAAPQLGWAQEAPWLVRLRAVHLDSANKGSAGLGLAINNKTLPDLDVSYFFSPQLAAELVLTYPQKQRLSSKGAEIGTLKHLPPTLTLQYHFPSGGDLTPYFGAGVNYTHFSNVEFTPPVQAALQPSIKKNSLGLALQAGLDYRVDKDISLNFDVKKVQISTDVSSAGVKAGTFKVDPWLIGFGIGWRF